MQRNIPEPIFNSGRVVFVFLAQEEPHEFRVTHFILGLLNAVSAFHATSGHRAAEYSRDHALGKSCNERSSQKWKNLRSKERRRKCVSFCSLLLFKREKPLLTVIVVLREIGFVDEEIVIPIKLPKLAVDHVKMLVAEVGSHLIDVLLVLEDRDHRQ